MILTWRDTRPFYWHKQSQSGRPVPYYQWRGNTAMLSDVCLGASAGRVVSAYWWSWTNSQGVCCGRYRHIPNQRPEESGKTDMHFDQVNSLRSLMKSISYNTITSKLNTFPKCIWGYLVCLVTLTRIKPHSAPVKK